jgi:uncharacterized protein YraI
VTKKILTIFFAFAFVLAGCGEQATPASNFVTATLPPTDTAQPAPLSGSTATAPAATKAAGAPVDGITTSQLNVRAMPSTVADSLGTIAAFSTVKIIGKESNGAWYQIQYETSPDGRGWITAAFVQVDSSAEIAIVETGAGFGAGRSGLVLQGVNVRSGPGTNYDSVGTLVRNDVVQATGKDSKDAWVQIEFKGGAGWLAAQYVQVDLNSLPVVAEAVAVPTSGAAATSALVAMQDNDSMEVPLASVSFSESDLTAFQASGWISPTNGDLSDWIGFTASGTDVLVEVKCDGVRVQIIGFENGQTMNEEIVCGQGRLIPAAPVHVYHLQLTVKNIDDFFVSPYLVQLKILR